MSPRACPPTSVIPLRGYLKPEDVLCDDPIDVLGEDQADYELDSFLNNYFPGLDMTVPAVCHEVGKQVRGCAAVQSMCDMNLERGAVQSVRDAKLERYRAKRKRRRFGVVRYASRRRITSQRERVQGRFVKTRKNVEAEIPPPDSPVSVGDLAISLSKRLGLSGPVSSEAHACRAESVRGFQFL